ncbi:GNAT family N-acetyltransferase [Natronospirillum operosum]|uniref:GNAT family N-acetyltransferase n=1 Tax=Natronospirillum operosum TaxID=2759953 RepID=A0A4Z0W257_9GAMM|nr:GNAT family N-acetyltransferase [Natronospirillum operosum]TGG90749.1 GNAT family N-acetyltransferase [Natronospirillum operosum]
MFIDGQRTAANGYESPPGSVVWRADPFAALSTHSLYAILKARVDIFVVEQICPYPELDDEDQTALHLQGWNAEGLAAYARILPPDSAGRVWIGRVLVPAASRRSGAGKELMQQALAVTRNHFPGCPIWIGAQLRLRGFYQALGFRAEGLPYLEDDIPHIKMSHAS